MLTGIEITLDFEATLPGRRAPSPLFRSTSKLPEPSAFWIVRGVVRAAFDVEFCRAPPRSLKAPGTSTVRSGALAPAVAGSSPEADRANASEAAYRPGIRHRTTSEGSPSVTLFFQIVVISLLLGATCR